MLIQRSTLHACYHAFVACAGEIALLNETGAATNVLRAIILVYGVAAVWLVASDRWEYP